MFYYPVDDKLKLKLLEKHHGQDLYNLIESSRNHLQKWVDCIKDLKSVHDCERFIIKTLNKYAQGFEMHIGIWNEEKLIGCICVINIDCQAKKAELGYYLGEDYQGNGYVTKSLRVIVDYLINERKFLRLEANVPQVNEPSIKVVENLGFKLEGKKRMGEYINKEYYDILLYGLLTDRLKTKII